MANSNHKLLLGMYSFQIKKNNTKDSEIVDINDFLSLAYPDTENKFTDGFTQEIINLIDEKTFKNKSNTHGGILEDKSFSKERRYFDLVIDGGLTGIKQFLLDGEGNKQTISKDKIVGLKFFARFWLPAGGKTGYMFIQRYGGVNLKPLFDELIKVTLKNHGYRIAGIGRNMRPITTKKRLRKFLEKSAIRDVTVISKNSNHDTGSGDAQTVTIKLKNIVAKTTNRQIDMRVISDAMKNHGFSIGQKHYDITATYESKGKNGKEERTTTLDASEDSINIIPSILLPPKCMDEDGYPEFTAMKEFVDNEIDQIKKESKMR